MEPPAGLALLTPLRLAVLLGSLGTDMSFETSLDVYSNGLRPGIARVTTRFDCTKTKLSGKSAGGCSLK